MKINKQDNTLNLWCERIFCCLCIRVRVILYPIGSDIIIVVMIKYMLRGRCMQALVSKGSPEQRIDRRSARLCIGYGVAKDGDNRPTILRSLARGQLPPPKFEPATSLSCRAECLRFNHRVQYAMEVRCASNRLPVHRFPDASLFQPSRNGGPLATGPVALPLRKMRLER